MPSCHSQSVLLCETGFCYSYSHTSQPSTNKIPFTLSKITANNVAKKKKLILEIHSTLSKYNFFLIFFTRLCYHCLHSKFDIILTELLSNKVFIIFFCDKMVVRLCIEYLMRTDYVNA